MSLQARPDLQGTFGMCASTHWIASASAQSVLERGGNAFDAAVSAAFVLHVVEPHLNGPGGELVAIVAPAGRGPKVLAGQGPAPAAASIERYRAEGLDLVPGAGALAAAVPGAVDAWLLLLAEHGTWELGDVLEHAIGYARDGHPLLASAAGVIATVEQLFRDDWPTSAQTWLPGGAAPRGGDLVRNEAYAATLTRLVEESKGAPTREARVERARRAWREGFVAEAIGAFVAATPHRHSTGGVHRGVMTGADVAAFEAAWEEPVSAEVRGVRVHKAGPSTQGPVLLQALTVLDGFDDAELDLATAGGVHRAAEAMKLALADRESHYGDAVPPEHLERLLSAQHAAHRRALIGEEASAELRPSRLDEDPWLPPLRAEGTGAPSPTAGEPTVSSSGTTRGDTCHVDVVDRWGNVVSATPSGGWLQSSPTVPALGFALGSRLQMTWLDPASPSALTPGGRPRTTLTPTVLSVDGEVVEALGSPGGDQQDQWQLLYLLRTRFASTSPQRAIEAPAFHTTSVPSSFWPRTWTPGGLVVEGRYGADVLDDLRARGHRVDVAGDWSLGRLSSVRRDPASGLLCAAANPRGAQGYAVGR